MNVVSFMNTDMYVLLTIEGVLASFAREAGRFKSCEAALKEARSMIENRSNQIQYDFCL